jgi:hypothetical protein
LRTMNEKHMSKYYDTTYKWKSRRFVLSALWLRIAGDYQLACNMLWLAVTCVVFVPMQTQLILAYSSNVPNKYHNHHHHRHHGAEPFLRSRQLCSYSRFSQHFMEPECSLPCSQEPFTGPSPEPDRSIPCHPILSL